MKYNRIILLFAILLTLVNVGALQQNESPSQPHIVYSEQDIVVGKELNQSIEQHVLLVSDINFYADGS